MSDAREDARLRHVEEAVIRIEERLNHVASEATVARIEATLNAMQANITANIATKAEVAQKPSRTEMWSMLGAMTGAFAVILTALTFLQHWLK